nr:DUF433 domain-containing protein [Actinokineospora globicatena]
MPFVAVVETYVLRSLRQLGLSMPTIKEAAGEVRRALDTPYALATKTITTDGLLDPRFGWGAPVIKSAKVPVDVVVDLWLAGESFADVAYEYDLTDEQVQAICRACVRAA